MENSMKFSQKPNNRTTMKGKSGVLVTQLFLTLCDPVGCSRQTPLSMEFFQAIILKLVVIPFSRTSS